MAEKRGEPIDIDEMWPDPASSEVAAMTPPAAPSVGPALSSSIASGPTSGHDLPPPPAQLVAALTEFETAGPESFSAVTTATSALPTTTGPAVTSRSLDEN